MLLTGIASESKQMHRVNLAPAAHAPAHLVPALVNPPMRPRTSNPLRLS